MTRKEPDKKKKHRSKRRQPADPIPSIRRPTHVVLWDDPPKGDAHEGSEDEQTSHEFRPCARGTRMNEMSALKLEGRRERKLASLQSSGFVVNDQDRAM